MDQPLSLGGRVPIAFRRLHHDPQGGVLVLPLDREIAVFLGRLVKHHYVIDPFPQSHLVARHRVGKETARLPSVYRVKERGHAIRLDTARAPIDVEAHGATVYILADHCLFRASRQSHDKRDQDDK